MLTDEFIVLTQQTTSVFGPSSFSPCLYQSNVLFLPRAPKNEHTTLCTRCFRMLAMQSSHVSFNHPITKQHKWLWRQAAGNDCQSSRAPTCRGTVALTCSLPTKIYHVKTSLDVPEGESLGANYLGPREYLSTAKMSLRRVCVPFTRFARLAVIRL